MDSKIISYIWPTKCPFLCTDYRGKQERGPETATEGWIPPKGLIPSTTEWNDGGSSALNPECLIMDQCSEHNSTFFPLALKLTMSGSHQKISSPQWREYQIFTPRIHTRQSPGHPTQGTAQPLPGTRGPVEPRAASPTLEDPETSRAGGLSIGIDSTTTIQITVIQNQALDLQRESTETAHRKGWGSVHPQLLIKQLLSGTSEASSVTRRALKNFVCLSLCYLRAGDV